MSAPDQDPAVSDSQPRADAAPSPDAPDFCPYRGLQPYTEADREYFFGRETDQQVIASNLRVAPLTVLYGASGVGKSSVLQAGVIPRLRERRRVAVVYFNSWQGASFDHALKAETARAVSESTGQGLPEVLRELNRVLGDKVGVGRSAPFDELLFACAEVYGYNILLIFDQFEEYFLYHSPTAGAEGFDAAFARAVNRREPGVNFMLSMREEELSKLDRFRVRIPNLLANLVRLEHLDDEAATRAVREPLRVYNEKYPGRRMEIESELVTAIIEQARPKPFADGEAGQTVAGTRPPRARIETPFLQLVLTRLWEEERSAGASTMRLITFERLGRAEKIAGTYLDEVMGEIGGREREVAAAVLRFLVTPTGSKIAQPPSALAAWTELKEEEVQSVLTRLSYGDKMRILRKVSPPGQAERYELFHDVLGPAILDWRTRYEQSKKQAEAERIVREHVEKAMAGLNEPERELAALFGPWLVTSSGVRREVEPENLAAITGVPQAQTEIVLNRLSPPHANVLRRTMSFPGRYFYSVSDDTTAAALIDWRRQYYQKRAALYPESSEDLPTPKFAGCMEVGLLAIYFVLLGILLVYGLYRFWPPDPEGVFSGPSSSVTFLFWTFGISGELRFIIVVMLAGALGALIQAVTSFLGIFHSRVLSGSWLLYYALLPFSGAVLGSILYFVVRGGVFSPTATAGDVNHLGFAALSGLAGMFTQAVFNRLRDIFQTLFVKPPNRSSELVKDSGAEHASQGR